ncbi:WXG100-like domain-containing protein [Speluncibacter jeojiensis]|uniref:WXG100-like domain-containing protein n=1 Tax=Speluncibacter jeojiensis TaxID=2710754 RepID=UPI00240FCCC9|nr:hypothetical protein [Rhodococcus sp. D2-41]
MTTLTVDPAEYAAAASQLARVGVDAAQVVSTLTGALDGSAGMAGSDHAGTAWADGYDQAAKAALEAASTAAAGAGQVATLLHATGQNHAHADAASTIGGGDATLPAPPAPLQPTSPTLPSAAGGIGAGPPGWSLVAGLVGYAWPNGHQDRLHAAQAAWRAAAGAMEQVATPIAAAASRVGAQQSPEAPAAASTCTQIGTHIGELAEVFTQLGKSCGEYAAHLDQAHHEIISVLRDLVVQTVAIEAGGAVLAFFTAGLDEIAAQAAVAARVASAAAKIRRVIEALIEAARVVATAVRGYLGKVVEITAKLKSVIGFGVKRAETMAVKGVDEVGELSAATKWPDLATTPTGLSAEKQDAIIAMEKGTRPNPSEYLSPDYINSHLAKFDDGASRFMPQSNLEKYGIAQRDGTSFVMPKTEADTLTNLARDNPRLMEQELGLPEGFLDSNNIVRVDIPTPGDYNLRIPSGNEAGANDQWIPGGLLPNGASEAVIDGGRIGTGEYSVTSLPK